MTNFNKNYINLGILIQDQDTSHFMESNGETIKTEHIYFWKLILWGMAPEQTNAQTNCTLCLNIDLTALKHIRQNPTLRATFMHYYLTV